jgi:predicted nuclease with TOPRIM domain
MAGLDEAMLGDGNERDVEKLMKLTEKRSKLEQEIARLMEEWDELEGFVNSLS